MYISTCVTHHDPASHSRCLWNVEQDDMMQKAGERRIMHWQVVSWADFTLPITGTSLFSKLRDTTTEENVLVIKWSNWLSMPLFWIILFFFFFEDSDGIQSSLSSTPP